MGGSSAKGTTKRRLIHAIVIVWLLKIVIGFFNAICNFWYRNRNTKLQPIINPLLLQPATVLADSIRKKQLRSEQVVKSYIERIKEVNPILNAVVDERFEEALNEAKRIDEFVRSGSKTPEEIERDTPLLGVPLTVKEVFPVKDMRQTIGMVNRRNFVADEDCETVKQLKEGGAIVIGVTNVPEMCWVLNCTSNHVYGRTNNAYDTNRCSGGSSGGEASIIGAAGSVIGIGNDFAGSLRVPAMFNGIFAHKPSPYAVSNHGMVPVVPDILQPNLCSGPMCRYASDLAPLLKLMLKPESDVRSKLDTKVDLSKLKLYYMEELEVRYEYPISSEMWECQQKVIGYVRETYNMNCEKIDLGNELHNGLMFYLSTIVIELEKPMLTLLNSYGLNDASLLGEVFRFLTFQSEHIPPSMVNVFSEVGFRQYLSRIYPRMLELKKNMYARLRQVLGEDGVLLFPSFPVAAPYHPLCNLFHVNYALTGVFNILGMPSTQFPVCFNSQGLPIGLQVAALRSNDHLTLEFAREMEKAFGGWRSPSS